MKKKAKIIPIPVAKQTPAQWGWWRKNFFTPHNQYLLIACASACLLSFFLPWYLYLVPVALHFTFWGISYFRHLVQREKSERMWEAYLNRYGNKKGEVPPDVRLRHKKMIEEGKKIPL